MKTNTIWGLILAAGAAVAAYLLFFKPKPAAGATAAGGGRTGVATPGIVPNDIYRNATGVYEAVKTGNVSEIPGLIASSTGAFGTLFSAVKGLFATPAAAAAAKSTAAPVTFQPASLSAAEQAQFNSAVAGGSMPADFARDFSLDATDIYPAGADVTLPSMSGWDSGAWPDVGTWDTNLGQFAYE